MTAALLRPAGVADQDFLARLYADTRREELATTGWPPPQVAAFLQMQFEAQRTDYSHRYPASDHDLVLVDGEPVGRIWVDRGPLEIRLLDVAILDSARNQGIGTTLIRGLQNEARTAAKPLRHSVVKENFAALRLYHRLDFVIIGDLTTHHSMEWRDPLA
jgi:ribosomal protein S18 acetylase RimI-like enzyme